MLFVELSGKIPDSALRLQEGCGAQLDHLSSIDHLDSVLIFG
jgi:hypothetical protein